MLPDYIKFRNGVTESNFRLTTSSEGHNQREFRIGWGENSVFSLSDGQKKCALKFLFIKVFFITLIKIITLVIFVRIFYRHKIKSY